MPTTTAKKYAFLSDPYVVGESTDPGPAHIPAEESLTQVISNDWVNEEYKHLIITASPKALAVKPGQFFNILCPSPDDGELWLRRPQSIYRIDRAGKRLEFLYKCVGRGTRGMATFEPGQDCNIVGPLGVGFSLKPRWKNIVVLGRGVGLATLGPISQLAADNGVRVTAILSARSPDLVMADDLFGQVGDVIRVLDTDGTSAVENVAGHPRTPDRAEARGCLLHLRLQPADASDEAARQEARHPGSGRDGADHGLRHRPLLRLRPHLRSEWPQGTSPGLHRRPGVRYAGVRGMVDLSVKLGTVGLKNPIMPASGCFSTDVARLVDVNRLGALVAKTVSREYRIGNPPPRVAELECGMINSIGLPTKGIEYFLEHQVPGIRAVFAAAGRLDHRGDGR